jgi:hypothetical protein
MRVGGVLTGITMGLVGKARKGFALTRVLWQWGWGRWCHRARSDITWPHPIEHEVQPHQGDQHQLVEKKFRDHSKTPSCKCRNEGILPGFQTTGISRRLKVHDQKCRGNIFPIPSVHDKDIAISIIVSIRKPAVNSDELLTGIVIKARP